MKRKTSQGIQIFSGIKPLKALFGVALMAPLAISTISCTQTSKKTPSTQGFENTKPGILAPQVDFSKPENGRVSLKNGQQIAISEINGIEYIPVQGISSASFQDLTDFKNDTSKIFSHSQFILTKSDAETGYFSGLMPLARYQELAKVEGLSKQYILNPVLITSQDHIAVKQLSEQISAEVQSEGVIGNAAYSGLKRIGEPDFRKKLAAEIPNSAIDGSLVKVGVADTGVTYNHPAFEDAEGKSRIVYMKDFTSEGTVYIAPNSKFSAVLKEGTTDVLLVNANYSAPKIGRNAPGADEFITVENLELKVSEAQKSEILNSENTVKLGVIAETSKK
jgi:subtilisin family serine protease